MGEIYNLEYDFLSQNGQSIVFSKKNSVNLTPGDLNAVQLKMIQSNQIPHMLPLSLENIDLEVKLHYDINSKQRLITYFRDNKTTMNDYYQLFLSIINTLEESGSYMLDQNKYILAMEFLYVGQNAGDVYLTYLPINEVEKSTSITEDMKKLLTEVAGEIEGLQGNEFKSILSYIKKSSFSITGLKKLLLELISLRSNVYQQQFAYEQPGQLNTSNMQENQNQVNNHSEPQERIVAGSENLKKTKNKKQLPPLTSRERLYTILATILMIAFAFKLYDMYPVNGMLVGSIILMILTIAGAITYWKFWRPGVQAVEVEVEENAKSDKQSPGREEERVQSTVQNHAVNQQQPQIGMKLVQQKIQPDIGQQQAKSVFQPSFTADYGSSALDTTLLNVDHDDTVLLEDEDEVAADLEGANPVEVFPILKRRTDDEEETTFEINTTNFLIGRNEESVNYTETALGVSRIHIEIIRIDGKSYGVKDLGSKNGSKLNSNPMVPYKLYRLNEKDVIELGKAQYIFSWAMYDE